MSLRTTTALLPLLAVLAAATVVAAQQQGKNDERRGDAAETSGRQSQPADDKSRDITPAREAAALRFAELHHPELHALLAQLKKHNRPQYGKALRQLFLDSERLAKLHERWPEDRYALELEAWKLDSRIRLLLAQSTMSDDPQLEEQLKTAYLQRIEIRLKLLQQERERVAGRLDKLDQLIDKLQQDVEQNASKVVLRDLEKMKKSARERRAQPNRPSPAKEQTSRPAKSPDGTRRSKPARAANQSDQ